MAVNNGCPDCQQTYGQSSNSNGSGQGANESQRSRTASPENGRASPTIFNPYYTGRPRTPASGSKMNTIDRQEIIKRIKSNGSRPTSPELEKSNAADRQDLIRRIKNGGSRPASPELERTSSNAYRRRRESPLARPTTPLSIANRPMSPEVQQDNEALGMQIERPRSALHRGDFREKEENQLSLGRFNGAQPIDATSFSTSPVAPWHPQFPTAAYRQSRDPEPSLTQNGIPIPSRPARDRTVSNASLTTSFVYKPPTSPLVQSSRPDTPEPSQRSRSRSPDKSRRHTFSPQSFKHFQSALEYPASARVPGRAGPPLRSEKTLPYQAHQPRRSLNTASFSSLPQSLSSVSRRPSISAGSPLHHAPLVGSYEESILRGRMSTVPSKPLNFMAQIGVLGRGNCKSSLRCPPHVSVPFDAVFYSYGSGPKNPTNDQPSPYVGNVNLEQGLANQEDASDRRRRFHDPFSNEGSRASSPRGVHEEPSTSDAQARRRKRQKAKRRSGSPKAPPGGSYRIPQQGQLQIVIKNPNKTAVKLFLVPYDLSDMEPGQKTFIRQRSYSAGPIIDMPLSSRKNLGTDRPEAAINATGDLNDKPVLRYLIHLQICCPSKGRYFLYRSIRVVFANRVPDGKEKLRNEIQLPDPRYSIYKPGRDSNVAPVSTATATKDPARRRTLEFHYTPSGWDVNPHALAQSLPREEPNDNFSIPTPTLPRHFTVLPTLESRPSSQHLSDGTDLDSISPGTPSVRSPVSSNGDTPSKAAPRLDDAFRFARESSRDRRASGRNESLLSRRLMDLAFQNQGNQRPSGDEI